MFKRNKIEDLILWKALPARKPMLVTGARQIGKSFLIKYFGQQHFRQVHTINLESRLDLHKVFQPDLIPQNIINRLSISLSQSISIEDDLLFFDEIQSCPNALTSLKYFQEELPSIAVIGAGSLLGLSMSDGSFPVGKVEQLNLFPLTFDEYLLAAGEELLLNEFIQPSKYNDFIHQKLWDHWKIYLFVGGMPSALQVFLDTKGTVFDQCQAAREEQMKLIQQYLYDISKHAGKVNSMHIEQIFKSIPAQLAKSLDDSVKRFRFTGVVPSISGFGRLASAFDWLEKAGLIYKIPIVDKTEIPLSQHQTESIFKAYLFDVGILNALSDLGPKEIFDFSFGTFKGYLAENYVLQALKPIMKNKIYGWNAGTAEIEFLLNSPNGILPVEVKAGRVTQAKSLQNFIKKNHPLKALIFGATLPRVDGIVHRLPLMSAGIWPLP